MQLEYQEMMMSKMSKKIDKMNEKKVNKKDMWKYLKTREGKLRFKEWSKEKSAENMAMWKAKY